MAELKPSWMELAAADMRYAEAAVLMGCSRDTAKREIRKAKFVLSRPFSERVGRQAARAAEAACGFARQK